MKENKQDESTFPKKIFCVISVARQVDGEMCVVKVEKSYRSASKADEYSKSLAKKYTESINTPYGPIPFICERGVFEVDVED